MRSYRLHRLFLALMLVTDAAVVSGAFLASWWIRFGSGWIAFVPPAPPIDRYWLAVPVIVLAYLVTFNYAGLYQRRLSIVGTGELGAIARGVAAASLLVFAAGLFYRGFSYSRIILAMHAGLCLVLLRAGRGLLHVGQVWLRRRGVGVVRVAILGDGPEAAEVASSLHRHPGYGFRLVGFIGGGAATRRFGRSLGPATRLEAILKRANLDEVLLAPARGVPRARTAEWFLRCRAAGVECRMLADVFGILTSRLALDDLFGLPMLALRPSPLARFSNRALKRAFDLALTVPALVVLSPLLLLLALAVKLSSPGPVFYRQIRVGRGGVPFGMYKFRSMRVDAERRTGPVWARKADPRVTPLGRLLRRFSLDELPQLLNIAGGSMSLVGPRPERPNFVEAFRRQVPRYDERHDVTPGLTGWSQINGLRGNTSVEERTRYDLYYVENWSVGLDARIIFRTAMEVFHHQEAY